MMTQMITANKTPRAITVIGYCLLVIVSSCSGDGSQMRAQLEELERQNRADSVMTNDSLAEHLVKYFDRHGTPNERMRAHYILGRTYADMGEAPRAVDAYLDAASQADTTAADCDYRTLSAVYSQMADVLHRQLLLSDEIEARKHSYHFAVLNGKPIIALSEKKLSASAYILLNKRDSAEMLLKEVLRQYEELGYVQEGIQASTMLMHLYIEIPEKKYELEHLIDRYDKESNMFDENHELHSKMRLFYYYKGKYYESINQLDSAEFYYRKVYHPEIASVAQNSMYKGLLNVFQKRHQADSIIKYAQLYCMVNDSSIALNDRQTTAQMAASYNYHLYQKEALQNAEKSYRATISLIIISILSVIILLVASYLIYRNRRKQQRLQEAYESAVDKREDLLKELEALRAHDYDTLISQKEDKIKEQNQTIAELEGRSGKVSLRDFKESQIVKTFAEKSQFSKDHPVPNQAEWDMLEQQFRKDMPGLYRLFEDKGLSDLEFRTCLLLLLDYDEGTVAGLTRSSSQTINSAKVRANQKLFNEKGAKSLHRALKKLI